MSADEAAVYDFATELLQTRQVSDANFKNMVDRFGERGVVETVGLMGHFHTLTMLFVVDKYPGAQRRARRDQGTAVNPRIRRAGNALRRDREDGCGVPARCPAPGHRDIARDRVGEIAQLRKSLISLPAISPTLTSAYRRRIARSHVPDEPRLCEYLTAFLGVPPLRFIQHHAHRRTRHHDTAHDLQSSHLVPLAAESPVAIQIKSYCESSLHVCHQIGGACNEYLQNHCISSFRHLLPGHRVTVAAGFRASPEGLGTLRGEEAADQRHRGFHRGLRDHLHLRPVRRGHPQCRERSQAGRYPRASGARASAACKISTTCCSSRASTWAWSTRTTSCS